jgi:hypothetical protein
VAARQKLTRLGELEGMGMRKRPSLFSPLGLVFRSHQFLAIS